MKLLVDTAGLEQAQALFGLPPLERLRRCCTRIRPTCSLVLSGDRAASLASGSQPLGLRLRLALQAEGTALVVVDAADAVDPRLLTYLCGPAEACVASRGSGDLRAVVLKLRPEHAAAIPSDAADLRAVADALLAAGIIEPLRDEQFPSFIANLRRSLPYWLFAVPDAQTRRDVEFWMFRSNYKGSTDFLTRWVFPPLVWPLVRISTRLGLHPNMITALSIVLAFAAVPLFAQGQFFWGFVAAFGMSVLDSVDGKVARLTLTSSGIGNVLDHGLDIVHPPFWYWAWAWGLGARDLGDPLFIAMLLLNAAYVGDRLVLMVAKWRLGHGLHAATPLDGQVRTWIARRNTNMAIMALALLFGAGAAGLFAVTAWQGLTLLWHGWRTLWLGFIRRGAAKPVHKPA